MRNFCSILLVFLLLFSLSKLATLEKQNQNKAKQSKGRRGGRGKQEAKVYHLDSLIFVNRRGFMFQKLSHTVYLVLLERIFSKKGKIINKQKSLRLFPERGSEVKKCVAIYLALAV